MITKLLEQTKQKPTILIVEDNEMNRELLESMLEDDFEMLLADNGLTGLAMLEQHGFEVVKCAHRLTDDEGPEVSTWFVIARRA